MTLKDLDKSLNCPLKNMAYVPKWYIKIWPGARKRTKMMVKYDAELRGKDGEHYLVYEGLAHRIEPEGSEAYRQGKHYRNFFTLAFIRQGLLGSLFFQASYMVRGYGCVLYGDKKKIVPHSPQPADIAEDLPLVAAWVIDDEGLDTLVLGNPLK